MWLVRNVTAPNNNRRFICSMEMLLDHLHAYIHIGNDDVSDHCCRSFWLRKCWVVMKPNNIYHHNKLSSAKLSWHLAEHNYVGHMYLHTVSNECANTCVQ